MRQPRPRRPLQPEHGEVIVGADAGEAIGHALGVRAGGGHHIAQRAEGAFGPHEERAGVVHQVGESPLRIEVYRAALYLPAPLREAAAILALRAPRLIEARYRRAVPLEGVRAAWAESLGPLPPGFEAWLRPIAAGDVERQIFLAEGARLEGPGRPAAELPGAAFARALLGCSIGPAAPTGALRRGLLGG